MPTTRSDFKVIKKKKKRFLFLSMFSHGAIDSVKMFALYFFLMLLNKPINR